MTSPRSAEWPLSGALECPQRERRPARPGQSRPGRPRPAPGLRDAGPRRQRRGQTILGTVTTIAARLGELRNRGHGTGHGPAAARVRLRPRHAHLAVNTAVTWCQLLLDTLADPEAP
ncbi:abortive infection family protein [Amycolatopsis sp. PS_44_ISF1]|uniref:abortive infection family protein n=1 Tax=Amycolatopsis sp. PS_44_ISF1 TaxID=2974917 RepID=UPI0037C0A66A